MLKFLKPTGSEYAGKVGHGNLRVDRPPHGRGGRATGMYLCVSESECHDEPVKWFSSGKFLGLSFQASLNLLLHLQW